MRKNLLALLCIALASSVSSAPQRGGPGSPEALGAAAEKELRGNILPFWLNHARDVPRGTFHALIAEDMSVRDDLPRGALLTSRILWTFSAAYRRYKDPQYLEMARFAYRDLMDHFVDRKEGGLFWTIAPDGTPLDGHKQVYGQVFGIYGLTEYFRATGDTEALEQAKAIYALIEAHAHDPRNLGYFDTLTRAWARPGSSRGNLLGEAPKSQNSHIHILEGFTNLLRVWPDPGLKARQRELIELTLTRIIDPKTHHLVLFMEDDWTPIGNDFSYGHDIELSWLVVEAATVLGDRGLLERARHEAVLLAKATAAAGVDADGGVYNDGNPRGVTNPTKDWWPQAEAAVGFLNAFQISTDPRFFADAEHSWGFIQARMVDPVHGDWYQHLHRDGTPYLEVRGRGGKVLPSEKLSIWKCPYHNGRACMEVIDRTHELAAAEP